MQKNGAGTSPGVPGHILGSCEELSLIICPLHPPEALCKRCAHTHTDAHLYNILQLEETRISLSSNNMSGISWNLSWEIEATTTFPSGTWCRQHVPPSKWLPGWLPTFPCFNVQKWNMDQTRLPDPLARSVRLEISKSEKSTSLFSYIFGFPARWATPVGF